MPSSICTLGAVFISGLINRWFSVDDGPTLRQLIYLRVTIGSKQLSISQVMGSHWKDLAFALELEHVYRVGYQTSCVRYCEQVLGRWLGEQASHTTWKRLVEALKITQHTVLAEKLEDLFEGEN